MAVTDVARRRFQRGALVPTLDCPVPGLTRVPGGSAPSGGSSGTTSPGDSALAALLAQYPDLFADLEHFLGYGYDGTGVNRSVELNDMNVQQLAWSNPYRVALGVTIPGGALAWHGFNNRVTTTPGQNAGTPLPAGASWIYGTEWTGSVYIVTTTPPVDVRVLEISSQ